MTRHPLSSLGKLVREKRGERKLREVAKEIGIGPATLMRVENGRIPDVATFGKLCQWLDVDPGTFLGFENKAPQQDAQSQIRGVLVSAHLRADQTPQQETAQALAQMILVALRRQPTVSTDPQDGKP